MVQCIPDTGISLFNVSDGQQYHAHNNVQDKWNSAFYSESSVREAIWVIIMQL